MKYLFSILLKFFLLFFLVVSTSNAQYYNADAAKDAKKTDSKSSGWDWSKVYPGGNAGLGFGRNFFYVEVSPLAGYWVNKWFTPGVMLTYIYFNSKQALYSKQTNSTVLEDFSGSIYGFSPFARAFVLKWLFFPVEPGIFNAKGIAVDSDNLYLGQERRWLFAPMVGGGVNLAFGQRGGFVVMFLYNLNYNSKFRTYGTNQPYTVRVGFYF